MPNWRDEYLSNIEKAQSENHVDRDLIAAYSQLLDRVTALEAEKAASQDSQPPQRPTPRQPPSGTPSPQPADDPSTDTKSVSRLRIDLAEALRQKGQLQSRLKTAEDELARLRNQTSADSRALRLLEAERKTLSRKLRDRDDELREKKKLVADVQDELAVLNMELTVAERERKRAQDETKVLVDRWMRRMGQEAEDMNNANEPSLARR
ncbi:autophagy protein 16 [Coniochaeta ligniaria NRRL 30616]|uniref:Autophagy protein 16 n=1 Tax=Coniochaeta ligniaria NRRL 30616 TaxID=1408157 RepID=A0A1J7J162_9PEZI|nr:autophagy protein 16 [Coniochaeta ligniaria NRRL 30616]